MEANENTPKFLNKAGEDEKLVQELNAVLDKEMDKSPDLIDVEKVDSIIQLLDRLDTKTDKDAGLSKELFAQKYLKNCGNIFTTAPVAKKYANYKNLKVAAGFMLILALVSISNFITVKATSKDIFSFVKEKAYILYFDVLGQGIKEEAAKDNSQYIQREFITEEQVVESWEEAESIVQTNFKTPQYIPDGLESESIHVQFVDKNDMGISRQYFNKQNSIRFLIRSADGAGKWTVATDEMDDLIIQKEINGSMVSIYKTDDTIQAVYQDTEFIYIIETNMTQETLEKIVEEMR